MCITEKKLLETSDTLKKHVSYLGTHFFTRKYPNSVWCGNVCMWPNAEFIINNIQRLSVKEGAVHVRWSHWKRQLWTPDMSEERFANKQFHIFHNWPLWDTALSSFLQIIKHIGIYYLEKNQTKELIKVRVPDFVKCRPCTWNAVQHICMCWCVHTIAEHKR